MCLIVLIRFWLILDGFLRFWTNSEIQDGRDQDGRQSEMDTQLSRHVTS